MSFISRPIRFMIIYGILTMANWAAAVGVAVWSCLSVLVSLLQVHSKFQIKCLSLCLISSAKNLTVQLLNVLKCCDLFLKEI